MNIASDIVLHNSQVNIFSVQHNCEIAAQYKKIQNDGSVRILLKYLKPILNEFLSIKQFVAADLRFLCCHSVPFAVIWYF